MAANTGFETAVGDVRRSLSWNDLTAVEAEAFGNWSLSASSCSSALQGQQHRRREESYQDPKRNRSMSSDDAIGYLHDIHVLQAVQTLGFVDLRDLNSAARVAESH